METPEKKDIQFYKFKRLILWCTIVSILIWILVKPVLNSLFLQRVFLKEDRLVELLTALAFILSFVISIANIRRFKSRGISNWFWLLPAMCLLAFLDEISYGWNFHKYFIRMKIYGKYIDSIHDFIPVGINFFKQNIPFGILYAIIALSVLLFCLFLFISRHKILDKIRKHPSVKYIFIGMGFAFLSVIIDLPYHEVEEFGFLFLLEETFEFYVSLSMVFASLVIPFSIGNVESYVLFRKWEVVR